MMGKARLGRGGWTGFVSKPGCVTAFVELRWFKSGLLWWGWSEVFEGVDSAQRWVGMLCKTARGERTLVRAWIWKCSRGMHVRKKGIGLWSVW